MRHFSNFLFGMITLFLIANTTSLFGQGSTCATADPFCTGTTYSFPNNTGTSSEGGNNYGCLTTQPNPAWYYLEIGTSGNLDILISQVDVNGSGIDVDFILYGPYASLPAATGDCGNMGIPAGEIEDCSYSTAATETANIVGAVAGQVYMMLITNYSNVPGNITFSQTGGTGATDCSIVGPPPCPTVGIHVENAGTSYPFPITLDCNQAGWLFIRANDAATAGGAIVPAISIDFTSNTQATGNNVYGYEQNGSTWNNYWSFLNLAANTNHTLTMYEVDNVTPTSLGVELCDVNSGSDMSYLITDVACGGTIASGTWIANDGSGGSAGPTVNGDVGAPTVTGGCQIVTFPITSVLGNAVYTCPTCPPGSFVATDYGQAFFSPTLAGPGSYAITYCFDNECGGAANCQGCATETVTVANPYTATTLSYPTPVCKAAGGTISPTLTGTAGGTYSSTGGLSINAGTGVINVAASTAATYTVTYTVGTMPCGATVSTTVTIVPDVNPAWTNPSPICASAGSINLSTLITGTAGGTWSGTGVSGTTFNPASGTQTVTYTVGTAPCVETLAQIITVNPDVNPAWTNPSPICASAGSINLSTLITGTAGGTWSGTGVSGTTFNPASGTQTVTYTVGTAPCVETLAQIITVNPDVNPAWTNPSPICASAGSINLNTLITGTAGGTWSGTGVSGTTFNPASGTQTVTYTVGTAPCVETLAQIITVNPDVNPAWTNPSPICASAGSINLSTLITGTAGGTWSGTGVSGTTFNPASGTQTVTYTVGTAPCVETLAQIITVNPDVNPAWTNPSPLCASAGSINLSTLITGTAGGTWSGTGVSGTTFNPASGTQTVTYTVGTAPCVETLAQIITVNPDVNPAWTNPSPLCATSGIINLSTLITGTAGGTWSGTGVSGNTFNPASGTQTVTYTVGTAPCVETLAQIITVVPDVDPGWTNPSPICASAGSINLNTLITGTAGGTWSGTGVSGTSFNPASGTQTVTYTVGSGSCQEILSQSISVTPDVNPAWTNPSPLCAISGIINLNTLITGTAGGTWSGTGVSGNTFNPASGTQTVTYTVGTAPCVETLAQIITVVPDVDPAWTNPSPICASAGSINLNTLITGTAGGTWSGTGVSGNTFNPASGTQTVTYTVGSGSCQEILSQSISVIPDVNPAWTNPSPICAAAGSINLNTLITGTAGGTWSGTGVSGNTFNPASGTQTVTYTVGTAPCVETLAQIITVNPDVNPAWTNPSPICASAGSINLNTLITGTAGGTWSGTGVSGTTFNPASGTQTVTYTVGTAPCVETLAQIITVNPDVNPAWTNPSPICAAAGSINLNTLITGTAGGTWSGTGVSGTTFNPASGTQTVTYTVGTAPCVETLAQIITVNPDVNPAWTNPSPICASAGSINLNTLITGTAGGTWSGTGVSGTTFNPASGTQTVTYTVGTAPCVETLAQSITVTPDVNPTWTNPGPVCEGSGSINLNTLITGTAGGTWSGTGVSGATFDPTGLSGNIAVTYTVGTAPCQELLVLNIQVDVEDNPNFSYPTGTYCLTGADPVATIIGTTGGTFTITAPGVINASNGTIDLSASGLGSYTITYNTTSAGNPCPNSTTFPITITSAPSAAFSYDSPNYCQDAIAPILSYGPGGSGGVFTNSPAGLSINSGTGAINLVSSTPGLYTIYNTIVAAGGCAAALDSTTIEIFQVDSALFSYSPLTYCISGVDPIANITGTIGGTFTITAPGVINASNGTIDLSASGLGSYTVTYNTSSAGNPCPAVDSTTITITSAPTGGFSYDAPTYCQDASAPILSYNPGASGGVFSATPAGLSINSGTGAINLLTSTPGVYTAYNTIVAAGGCAAALDSTTIEVFQVDSALFNYSSLTNCITGVNPTAVITGTTGGTFTITAPGIINASTGEIDLINSGLGTFTVYYNTTAAGNPCPSIDSVIVNIVNAPEATFTYNTPLCEGSTTTEIPTFGVNSFAGVFSSNPAGVSFVSTSTGEIDLTTSTAGTYIIYNNLAASGGCAAALDSFQIVINPMYITSLNQSICQGDSILLGGAYQTNAGVYNDTSATVFGCDSILQTTLAINPVIITPQNATICTGDSILLGGAYQTIAGVYEDTIPSSLGCDSILQTTLAVNSVIIGNVNISICQGDSVFVEGGWVYTSGVYNDSLTSVGGCDSVLITTVTVTPLNTIIPDPIAPICASDPIIISATGSGAGTITWYSDAAGTTVIGTGSPLVITNPGVGTYTYYVNEVGTCSSSIDSVTVVVGGVNAVINATPLTGAIPLDVFFGNGSTTGAGIIYTWDFGDGNTSNQFEPSNIYNTIGIFTVTLIVTDGICSDTAYITIDAFGESVIIIPNVFTPNGDGSNDVFTVDGENLESVEGEIFNRWGQKMFSWNNVKGYWDGRTLSGSEAPDGTYFYIISAKGFDGKEYFKKGGFSLIR